MNTPNFNQPFIARLVIANDTEKTLDIISFPKPDSIIIKNEYYVEKTFVDFSSNPDVLYDIYLIHRECESQTDLDVQLVLYDFNKDRLVIGQVYNSSFGYINRLIVWNTCLYEHASSIQAGYIQQLVSSIQHDPYLEGENDMFAMPIISRIIINNPAVVVIWSDGTKTVSKCMENDTFNEETGLAMAISKKYMECIGAENPRGAFKRLLKYAEDQTTKTEEKHAYLKQKKEKYYNKNHE